MKRNWFTLIEIVIVLIMIWGILAFAIQLQTTIAWETVRVNLLKWINTQRQELYNHIFKNVYETDIQIATYEYSEILQEIPWTNEDWNEVELENTLRWQFKSILENDWITLTAGKINWVVDERIQKEDHWWYIDFDTIDFPLKQYLIEAKVCKSTSIFMNGKQTCDVYNNISDIDENFDILVVKSLNNIHMYYVKDGLLKSKVFQISNDTWDFAIIIDENPIQETTFETNKTLEMLKYDNVQSDSIMFPNEDIISPPIVYMSLCHREYEDNNIIYQRLVCK